MVIGVPTQIRGCHVLSPLFTPPSPPPTSTRRFPGLPLIQTPPAPTSSWPLRIPAFSCFLHISHILALFLCIDISCYVVGRYTPQLSTVPPPIAPHQLVSTPNYHLVSFYVAFLLVVRLLSCRISPVPSRSVGPQPTSLNQIVILTAQLIYRTPLTFFHLPPPGSNMRNTRIQLF